MRVRRSAGLLAGVVAVIASICAPTPGGGAPGGAAPLAKGWGRVIASGTIMGVEPSRGALTLAITGDGHVDWAQGGTAWRRGTLTGTRRVRLLGASVIVDAGGRAVPIAGVRPGAPAMLWAVAQPDGEVVGLTVEIASPRVAMATAPPGSVSRTGVVLGRSGSTVDLLTSAGSRRSIILTGATVVRVNGQVVPPAAVAPYDILRVGGPLNSDGSLAATLIDIGFSAPDAARISGPVEEVVTGLGGLVVAQTMVATTADTYVVRGNGRAEFSQVAPGRPTVVYGVPVLDRDTPIGLSARVVVIR
jgi:hypothetical protein